MMNEECKSIKNSKLKSSGSMEGIADLLNKFSFEDIEKMRFLMSFVSEAKTKEMILLETFVTEYKKYIKQNRSAAYYTSVNNSFKHLLDFFKPQRLIQSIGLKETEEFISNLQTKVKKGYRVYVRTLKAAFNKAVEWGYIKENYFLKVKLPKKQKVRPVFINSDQLSAISRQIKNNVVRDIVIVGFYTGMRLDEIINLRWKNVDIKTRIITVGDEEFITKGRNQRFIPISDEAMEVLLRLKKKEVRNTEGKPHLYHQPRGENNGYVFCKENGRKFTGDHVSRRFKLACEAAGMDKAIHFHSLRHSFASNLVQQGVSLYKVKELLGHSSITTTEIYSHLNIDSLREAISVFDEQSSRSSLSLSPRSRLGNEGKNGNEKYTSGLKLIVNNRPHP